MPLDIESRNTESLSRECLVRLQAVYDSLKTAEKKAADLLINRPEFIGTASIVDAAREADCSEATYVRLSKRLGYAGFQELKAMIGKENSGLHTTQLYSGLTSEDSYDTVIQKVFDASLRALSDTLRILDREQYQLAVEALCNAGMIVLAGAGDAANVAKSGFQKLFRAGIRAHTSDDIDQLLIAVSQMRAGDVLLVISHSGRTKNMVELVKYSKKAGITVICITNYPVSPLAKNSDIVLLTAAFTEHIVGEVMSKRVTELCIVECLFVSLILAKAEIMTKPMHLANAALENNKL